MFDYIVDFSSDAPYGFNLIVIVGCVRIKYLITLLIFRLTHPTVLTAIKSSYTIFQTLHTYHQQTFSDSKVATNLLRL